MRKSFVALLLVVGATSMANLAFAAIENDLGGSGEGIKLINAQQNQELRSRSGGIGTSTNYPHWNDTTFVGYTPGHFNAATNWWSIYSGTGKGGFKRPPARNGYWDWEPDGASYINGDSLQGWWPMRNIYNATGGQTRTDRNRAWWAVDIGNTVNYVPETRRVWPSGEYVGKSFGVNGVWHRDGGSTLGTGAIPRPAWAPLGGSFSAWMGLRAHGDVVAREGKGKLNPFNEDLLMFNGLNAASASGNDKHFPGYGNQMDQMLYRDIAGVGSNTLTIAFDYRTDMSTDIGTAAGTRTGWFDADPLAVTSGAANPQLNNFISSSDAGATAPADSFMVYIGAGVDGATVTDPTNPVLYTDGHVDTVYDKKHRWFDEVLHWDRDPNSDPANPQPLTYRELLSVGGNHAVTHVTRTVSAAALAPMLQKNGKIRLVFRVKTNSGFSDEGTAYTSLGAGAAVVDNVTYQIGAGAVVNFGDFENATSIDNNALVSAQTAWKSTGKPPAIFHHPHALSDLIYTDLCGQPGDVSRICDLNGVVISAGDHDQSEAAGGLIDGTAERERFDGIYSPTINFTGGAPGVPNAIGLYPVNGNTGGLRPGDSDINAEDDMYADYDLYAGIMDPFSKGNLWRFGFMSYPANAAPNPPAATYPAWGQVRFPAFIIFNPDQQCFRDLENVYGNSMVKTSNATGIPDSCKFYLGKLQECFRFGVSTGCSPTDGCYWDNADLTIIDGPPIQLSSDIWNWINDSFPANETAGLAGVASKFDTTSAILKTGLNTGPNAGSITRADVPGDSVVILSSPTTSQVDMIFRILPGPGNYTPVGDPHTGFIRRLPNNPLTVTPGDGSFWDAYRSNPGAFASPSAVAKHAAAKGGWDANVWNSARCDTAEVNVFSFQSRGVLGGPADTKIWVNYLHESDPHFATQGQVKPRCYIKTPTSDPNDVVCDGTVPSYVACNGIGSNCASTGYAANSTTTREYTKIIPDGILTPGSHVEYFFRDVKTGDVGPSGIYPDTNRVSPQVAEGSTDGHRWQEFSVLPDRWKDPAYRHPLFQTFGRGPACLLVVDYNDRRGNERVWVSVADTIGATAQQKWGAHNGWHAKGGQDVNDAAQNVDPQGRVGFTAEHGGSPGTTWDMYQVKASESLTTQAGSLGSRLANRTDAQTGPKSSRQGPTPDMMDAYYTIMMLLSGDLNSGVLGPFAGRSQNDVALITGWLQHGNATVHNRGIWAIGDGFVESNIGEGAGTPQEDLMFNYFGVNLRNNSYALESGNIENVPDLIPIWRICPVNPGDPYFDIWGVGNLCLWTNDVLERTPGLLGLTADAAKYEDRPGPALPMLASVFKEHSSAKPWQALADGWDIEHIMSRFGNDTRGRSRYYYEIFTWLWSKIWTVAGTPLIPLEVPQFDNGELVNFVNLRNNPLRAGNATIHFGLAKADRVKIDVYDVTGRLVKELADRTFGAGPQTITWDGVDNSGREAPRGVYFTQVKYFNSKFVAARKLTLLK